MVFNPKNNNAGNETHKLSLTLNLAKKPKNINKANPPEEINKIELFSKPTSKPVAPSISSTAVIIPNFASPNRTNSLFICGHSRPEVFKFK